MYFDEDSTQWLKKKDIGEGEQEQLAEIMDMIRRRLERGEGPLVKMPKDTSDKVSALAYLLDSVEDVEGNMLAFKGDELLSVPDEARERYDEALQVEKLDNIAEQVKGQMRKHSYPKRRSSVLK
jgi:hypothetical protein